MKWGLSFVFFFLITSVASSQEIGKVKYIVSPVTVVRDGAANIAVPDGVLRLNDIVRTGQNGRARLVLLDGSELTLGPQTELRVVAANPAAQQTTIEMLYGRLRAHVTSVTKTGGIFQVRTPVGIAVALGSELEVDTVLDPVAGNIIETAESDPASGSSRADLKNGSPVQQKQQQPATSPTDQTAQMAQFTDQAVDVILGGQQGTGSISGALGDTQGALLSNAPVSARNLETLAVYTTHSDSSGEFRFNLVPAGTYTLTYMASGFKTLESRNLAVGPHRDTCVGHLRMPITGSADNVGLISTASIEATQTQVTNTFSGAQLSTFYGIHTNEVLGNLPPLIPGIASGSNNTIANGGGSAHGLRGRNNDQAIDGQNNNDNSVGGPGLFLSNPEFVQQYITVTNQFGTAYGSNAASVANMITNPGDNAWLNALTPTQTGQPAAPSGYIPLDFSAFQDSSRPWLYSGSPIQTGGSSPNLGSTFTPGLITNPSFASNWTLNNNDFTLGSDTITSRYLFNRGNNFNLGGNGSQGWIVNPSGLSQSLIQSWTNKFDAHLVNEARVSFNRLNVDFSGNTLGGSLQIGPNFTFNPQLNFTLPPTSSTTLPQGRIVNTWQAQDNWNYVLGKHNFMFRPNVAIQPWPNNLQSGGISSPWAPVFSYSGLLETGLSPFRTPWSSPLVDSLNAPTVNITPNLTPTFPFAPYMLGDVHYYGITPGLGSSAPASGITPSLDFRQYDTFLYGVDDWKIKQNLTLNLGPSLSYYGTPANLYGAVTPPVAQTALPRNSFGPSISFAYSPRWGGFLTARDRTTFRGGYSMAYDPAFNNILQNMNTVYPTNFAQNPLVTVGGGPLTQFHSTGQYSRYNLKTTNKYGENNVTGYIEFDFNGNDASNVFVSTNPRTDRLRMHWVDLKRGKWEFLGGQTWGLQTSGLTGLSLRRADLDQTIRTRAQVPISAPFTRVGEFRTSYHFNDNLAYYGGNFNALTPFIPVLPTPVLPSVAAPPAPLTILGQISSGAVPGNGTDLNLTNFTPLISMNVTALDHYAAVLSWTPGSKATYGKPGQMITVNRGKTPDAPIPIFSNFGSTREVSNGGGHNEIHFEEFDSSGKPCIPNIVIDGVAQNLAVASTFTYTVSGNNTSTGPSALKLDVTNSGTCPLYFLTTFGAVFRASSTAHQIGAVAGILLGGDLNLNDVKSYQLLESFGGFLIVPPIQVTPSSTPSKSGPNDMSDGDNSGVYSPEIPPGAASTFLRSYCLELHKLAPHTNTRYKFADNDTQQKLNSNGSIISRVFDMVQSRTLEIPKGHTLDSVIQWTLWSSREGMDEKKFREAYRTLARHNYEAQKKWNKDMQKQVEESADVLWPIIQKVLGGI